MINADIGQKRDVSWLPVLSPAKTGVMRYTQGRSLCLNIVFFVVSCLFSFPALGAEGRLPVPRSERLPNGLELAWFENESLPVIDLALLVKSGTRDDPPGKSGTAELMAAALDRGSGGKSAHEIARSVERLGASRYTSANDDTLSVGVHGLAPDASTLLEILGRIALQPNFAETEVTREKTRLLDRWSHLADYGEALASLAFQRAVTRGTSYGRGSILSARELASVSRTDVVSFHRKHFTPANSVLMIVGRVRQEEFRKEVLRIFGSTEVWSGGAPARDWRNYADSRLPLPKKGGVILVDRPKLTQAQVRIGLRSSLIQAPERYPLEVANALLGEYFNSRLNALIRDKLGLTYGIGSSISYRKELGVFSINTSTRNESVGHLILKTMEVLRDLRKGPIPSEEVQMAKEYLQGGFPLGTATVGAVAARWLAGHIYELGPEYLNEYVPKVSGVSPEQVQAAVMKTLDLDRMVIVVAGDAHSIAKHLTAAKLGPIIRVEARQLLGEAAAP